MDQHGQQQKHDHCEHEQSSQQIKDQHSQPKPPQKPTSKDSDQHPTPKPVIDQHPQQQTKKH